MLTKPAFICHNY